MSEALRVARLGTVGYDDALALQHELHARHGEPWLLLLEHPHVYTLGVRARDEHVLVEPSSVGAELVRAPRGGDVTYHGPGQLVGYPIVDVPTRSGSVPAHVAAMEQIVIEALADVGLDGGVHRDGFPGVWVDDRKIAACGVRIAEGRSMHGFAVNVDPDLTMFDHIVPCGIHGIRVTSLAAEGHAVTVDDVADAVERRAAERWGDGTVARRDDVRPGVTPARC
jgi:lipoic acid synthetase